MKTKMFVQQIVITIASSSEAVMRATGELFTDFKEFFATQKGTTVRHDVFVIQGEEEVQVEEKGEDTNSESGDGAGGGGDQSGGAEVCPVTTGHGGVDVAGGGRNPLAKSE